MHRTKLEALLSALRCADLRLPIFADIALIFVVVAGQGVKSALIKSVHMHLTNVGVSIPATDHAEKKSALNF